jgi:hypothetical protein
MLSMTLFASAANASIVNCDWQTIQKVNGNYLYSPKQHICVGRLVFNQIKDNQQIDELTKSNYDLKDALKKADAATELWKAEDVALIKNVNSIKSHEKTMNWIYFGLGFLAASAAVYGASHLSR